MSNFNLFERKLSISLIAAKRPLIVLEAFDYRFVVEMLKAIKNDDFDPDDGSVSVWDTAFGSRLFYSKDNDGDGSSLAEKIKSLSTDRGIKLLIAKVQKETFVEHPELISLLQDFVYYNNLLKKEKKRSILLVSPYPIQLEGLEHSYERLTMPLPDKDDISKELGFSDISKTNLNKDYIHGAYHFSRSFMSSDSFKKKSEDLVNALLGMHLYDIRSLLQTVQAEETHRNVINAFYIRQTIDGKSKMIKMSERILEAKKQIVQNSGLLEIVDVEDGYEENVGNIDRLRDYLERRRLYIDKNMLLPLPKGILLVGEPGCGKSETAKAISSILKKPLLRLNMGGLLGQYVGQSENNFIEALRTAEAAQPCILWIDEIEKAFAGAGKDMGNNDIVMTRIIGIFLTWMQEHKGLVYLVATANDLSLMKDEFLRKGRWDEIFYLSKPNAKGRIDILIKSLNRYKLILCDNDTNNIEIDTKKIVKNDTSSWEWRIAELMDDMSGADIASVIVSTVQEVYGDEKKQFEYPYLPVSNLEKNIKDIKDKKDKTVKERIELHVKSDLLEIKIQERAKVLEKEDILKSHLRERYAPKSKEEKESEYKAMGYISAAD